MIIVIALLLAIITLGGTVFAPRADGPVALIPMTEHANRSLPKLIKAPETLLLGRGSLAGSYVVSGAWPSFWDGLGRHKILILNATAPGCGPARISTPAGDPS